MTKLSLTRWLGVAVGGLTLSLTAGAAVASADPDLGSAINTTCTYGQFVAALNAENPAMAEYFNSSPQMQAGLRQFLAGSPSQRRQWAQEMASAPQNQPYLGVVTQAFNTATTTERLGDTGDGSAARWVRVNAKRPQVLAAKKRMPRTTSAARLKVPLAA